MRLKNRHLDFKEELPYLSMDKDAMRQRKRNKTSIYFVGITCFFMSICVCGCARAPIKISEQIRVKPPASVERKIQMRIGLYMSPAFKNYAFRSLSRWVLLGNGMSRGAKSALKSAFKEVVIIDESETDLAAKHIDAIMTPVISRGGIEVEGGISPHLRCYVNAKWTILDNSGNVLYVNSFISESKISDRFMHVDEDMSTCITAAVEDQYDKLLAHILMVFLSDNNALPSVDNTSTGLSK